MARFFKFASLLFLLQGCGLGASLREIAALQQQEAAAVVRRQPTARPTAVVAHPTAAPTIAATPIVEVTTPVATSVVAPVAAPDLVLAVEAAQLRHEAEMASTTATETNVARVELRNEATETANDVRRTQDLLAQAESEQQALTRLLATIRQPTPGTAGFDPNGRPVLVGFVDGRDPAWRGNRLGGVVCFAPTVREARAENGRAVCRHWADGSGWVSIPTNTRGWEHFVVMTSAWTVGAPMRNHHAEYCDRDLGRGIVLTNTMATGRPYTEFLPARGCR